MTNGRGFDALFRTNSGRASLNPIFSWVRLAQRVPVRIHIDQVPDGVRLAAGMTATVQIDSQLKASKR
jgi:multidrug resistance efflux pump